MNQYIKDFVEKVHELTTKAYITERNDSFRCGLEMQDVFPKPYITQENRDMLITYLKTYGINIVASITIYSFVVECRISDLKEVQQLSSKISKFMESIK